MESLVAALIPRLVGAIAGAALALIVTPPRTRSGFFRRLAAALIFGPIFAGYVRYWAEFDQTEEGLLAAACLASFVSWSAMGAVNRAAHAWKPKINQEE